MGPCSFYGLLNSKHAHTPHLTPPSLHILQAKFPLLDPSIHFHLLQLILRPHKAPPTLFCRACPGSFQKDPHPSVFPRPSPRQDYSCTHLPLLNQDMDVASAGDDPRTCSACLNLDIPLLVPWWIPNMDLEYLYREQPGFVEGAPLMRG